jgi:hypothetical protein
MADLPITKEKQKCLCIILLALFVAEKTNGAAVL